MERFTKETLSVMSKEELQEIVEALQFKLEVAEKEISELKKMAEIGRKYYEHLNAEAIKLVKLVEGEKSAMLKLIEKADIDTLKEIVEQYSERAKQEYKASAKVTVDDEDITPEKIASMNYKDLIKLREKFAKEVK